MGAPVLWSTNFVDVAASAEQIGPGLQPSSGSVYGSPGNAPATLVVQPYGDGGDPHTLIACTSHETKVGPHLLGGMNCPDGSARGCLSPIPPVSCRQGSVRTSLRFS